MIVIFNINGAVMGPWRVEDKMELAKAPIHRHELSSLRGVLPSHQEKMVSHHCGGVISSALAQGDHVHPFLPDEPPALVVDALHQVLVHKVNGETLDRSS